ncbi:GNAT family N-acetyltransferase [Deinococcus radiophilus]|uniref:GNAT family N-acetyltransferase n=1 Tax=Deinococcus radiophilus TaxID=32062 RepID=UPI00361D6654
MRPLESGDDWHQLLNLRLAVNAGQTDYLPFAQRKVQQAWAMQQAGAGAYWGAFVGRALRAALGIYQAGTHRDERLARYQSVETHPDWRSQGLAGNLVVAAGDWARRDLGADRLVIVADTEYHAQALYQRLGFGVAEPEWALERPPSPAD